MFEFMYFKVAIIYCDILPYSVTSLCFDSSHIFRFVFFNSQYFAVFSCLLNSFTTIVVLTVIYKSSSKANSKREYCVHRSDAVLAVRNIFSRTVMNDFVKRASLWLRPVLMDKRKKLYPQLLPLWWIHSNKFWSV